jgi:hypothetical protein
LRLPAFRFLFYFRAALDRDDIRTDHSRIYLTKIGIAAEFLGMAWARLGREQKTRRENEQACPLSSS